MEKETKEPAIFWLRYLTDDLKSIEEANKILNEYNKNEKHYKSVMNAIVYANQELFKEASKMCEALLEIMKEQFEDEFDVREKAAVQKAKIQLIKIKLSKGKSVEAIAEDLEDSVENILALMKEMDQEKEVNK